MLCSKVKAELEKMEEMKIISKVDKPTKWVNSIVIVTKPSGDVRICLDPRNLNKAIRREHYPMKTAEDIAANLKSARIFSKLDASSGFYQIKLAEESTWLTTFNTPFGRYKVERLPFGINSAPEIFQRTLSQIFENIEGCNVIVDDILIWGSDEEEHNDRPEKVLKQCKGVDLKLNKQRCVFGQSEIEYVGHIFSADGMKPSVEKTRSVTEMSPPEDKKSLQRFLGMVNHLGKFISNLATVAHPLRELLEKSVEWHWTERHESTFDRLKVMLTEAPVFRYYNVDDDVMITVDSSTYGMRACLKQKEQPVAYTSRTLNTAERNHAQIEKEMLAIVYGLSKFHQYVYGKRVTVIPDHKPLESLFKKPLSKAPQRIQRMMLKVKNYDIEEKYSPGKHLHIADTLSRAPVQSDKSAEMNLSQEFEINILVDVSHKKAMEIMSTTDNDEQLSKVKDFVVHGWPNDRSQITKDIVEYWNISDEISICDGLLLKGDRIIIPGILREEMLINFTVVTWV